MNRDYYGIYYQLKLGDEMATKNRLLLPLVFVLFIIFLFACNAANDFSPSDDYRERQEEAYKVLECYEKQMLISSSDTNEIESEQTMNIILDDIRTMSQDKIHRILGEPSGALFGTRGDVYLIQNETKVNIYYSNDGVVKSLVIINKDDEITYKIE